MTTTNTYGRLSMRQIKRLPCSRCGLARAGQVDPNTNLDLKHGVVVGVICGRCQTVEESLEAQIHEATLDYSVDQAHQLVINPKATA
jgi:hypothetical protein